MPEGAEGDPVRGLVFEELELGRIYRTEPHEISEEAIVAFGAEWDPEPFHLDRDAARDSVFGELVASGWHTLLVSFRLFRSQGLLRGTALAGTGIADLRFRRPVKPGNKLQVSFHVAELLPTSHVDRGRVVIRIETWNEDKEVVLDYSLSILVRRATTERGTGASA